MNAILNETLLQQTKEIMQDNFPVMVEIFLEDTINYIDAMEKAITDKDINTIATNAHTLKSSSLQLGAEKLSNISKEIEGLSRTKLDNNNNEIKDLADLITSLKEAFSEVEPKLKDLLS